MHFSETANKLLDAEGQRQDGTNGDDAGSHHYGCADEPGNNDCASPEIGALIELLGCGFLDSTLDLGDDAFTAFHGSASIPLAERQELRRIVLDHLRGCGACRTTAEGERLTTETTVRILKGEYPVAKTEPGSTVLPQAADIRETLPRSGALAAFRKLNALSGVLRLNRVQRLAIVVMSFAGFLLKLRDSHLGVRMGVGAAIAMILLPVFFFKLRENQLRAGEGLISPVTTIVSPSQAQIESFALADRYLGQVVSPSSPGREGVFLKNSRWRRSQTAVVAEQSGLPGKSAERFHDERFAPCFGNDTMFGRFKLSELASSLAATFGENRIARFTREAGPGSNRQAIAQATRLGSDIGFDFTWRRSNLLQTLFSNQNLSAGLKDSASWLRTHSTEGGELITLDSLTQRFHLALGGILLKLKANITVDAAVGLSKSLSRGESRLRMSASFGFSESPRYCN